MSHNCTACGRSCEVVEVVEGVEVVHVCPSQRTVELRGERAARFWRSFKGAQSAAANKPATRQNRNAYPTSARDDSAMSRKRRNSFLLRRADPSTMLTAAENAARRVCEVRPYCSSVGKCLVARYTASASS